MWLWSIRQVSVTTFPRWVIITMTQGLFIKDDHERQWTLILSFIERLFALNIESLCSVKMVKFIILASNSLSNNPWFLIDKQHFTDRWPQNYLWSSVHVMVLIQTNIKARRRGVMTIDTLLSFTWISKTLVLIVLDNMIPCSHICKHTFLWPHTWQHHLNNSLNYLWIWLQVIHWHMIPTPGLAHH